MDNKAIFKKINAVAKKEKTPVHIVGGFVRDFLMKSEQKKDIDFVVVGSGLEFAKKFDKAMKEKGSLVEFPDFDTARYILGEEDKIILEFAGARAETYDPKSRKPAVKAASLEDDLSRRDFTVNAMAVPVSAFAGLRAPSLQTIKKYAHDQ